MTSLDPQKHIEISREFKEKVVEPILKVISAKLDLLCSHHCFFYRRDISRGTSFSDVSMKCCTSYRSHEQN